MIGAQRETKMNITKTTPNFTADHTDMGPVLVVPAGLMVVDGQDAVFVNSPTEGVIDTLVSDLTVDGVPVTVER